MFRLNGRKQMGLVLVVIMLAGILGTSAMSAAKVELVLWDNTEVRRSLTQQFADEYMKENPDVSIVCNSQASIDQKLAVAIAGGAPPDMVQLHNAWAERFISNLQPYPKDMFPRAELNKRNISFDMTSTMNGEVYYLPLGIMNGAIYYNNDMLNNAGVGAPPKDWTNFIKQAKKLTRMKGDGTLEVAGFSFLGNFSWMWTDLVYQNGGTLFNRNGGVTFSSAASHNGWNNQVELRNSTIDMAGSNLAKGSAATYYSWTHFQRSALQLGFDWGVSEIPTPTGSSLPARGRMNVEIGIGVINSIPSANQEAAFRFIKWLYNNADFIAQLSNQLGVIPSRQDIWSHKIVQSNRSMQLLMKQAPYSVFPGPVDNWYWDLMNEAANRIKKGEEGLSAVLDDVQRRGDAKYQEKPIHSVEHLYVAPGK